MSSQASGLDSPREAAITNSRDAAALARSWFAVFTVPRHEKSVIKHLDLRNVESFLPTYETVRVWKNRQRMKIALPLFPTYLFVHINPWERAKVLESPGVLQIVGSRQEPSSLTNFEIELLRSSCREGRAEPFGELIVGQRVRIKRGPMEGVKGTLVRKNSSMKFVLTFELINQHAAIHVDAASLEPVSN